MRRSNNVSTATVSSVALLCLVITGCASNSGVLTTGPDTYMVSRQAATGFSGLGTLKADAIAEAKAFCRKRSLELQVVNTAESKPPYLAGNFPRAEVNFMCLRAEDPELSRPKLRQQPDIVVESSAPEPTPVARLVSVSIESCADISLCIAKPPACAHSTGAACRRRSRRARRGCPAPGLATRPGVRA